ncbi:MAG TPA: response regulator, partial [Myxococcota bacterium]|nr:response regulator [Myxococcota bacterium]
DAALVRETTRLLLERAGHEVTTCDAAENARARLAERFDVLVTDLRLPGESGASLSQFALSTWPELHVVLISGYLAEEDLSFLENDPRARLLPKPFTSKALLDAVGGAGTPRAP